VPTEKRNSRQRTSFLLILKKPKGAYASIYKSFETERDTVLYDIMTLMNGRAMEIMARHRQVQLRKLSLLPAQGREGVRVMVKAVTSSRSASFAEYPSWQPAYNSSTSRMMSTQVHANGPISNLKVFWGSHAGTARLFASDLADELSGQDGVKDVQLLGLNDASPVDLLSDGNYDALIFVVACDGVGQPTDNAGDFMDFLNSPKHTKEIKSILQNKKYAVFGLGNSKTHSHTYNIVGKTTDARLAELGAQRLYPMGLGDDSECIDDDFDHWAQGFLEALQHTETLEDTLEETGEEKKEDEEASTDIGICLGELAQQQETQPKEETRHVFPTIITTQSVEKSQSRSKTDRWAELHTNPSMLPSFYLPGTQLMAVGKNQRIAASRGGLYEMTISLPPKNKYKTGDHMWVYGENHPAMVDGYARAVDAADVLCHSIVDVDNSLATKKRSYPYPLGLTVKETLRYCVDLGAVPSPSFARSILGHSDFDYRTEISDTRVTALELLLQPHSRKLTLSELLYQLPLMLPRHYSIASSPMSEAGPSQVLLAYRPVEYVSSRGTLRVGTCTHYMTALQFVDHDMRGELQVAAGLRSNPEFRLPENPQTPLLLIAGGCGIAPVRAFLEERIAMVQKGETKLGPAYLFFGVRSHHDMVYHKLMQQAVDCGALVEFVLSYSSEEKMVADSLDEKSQLLSDLLLHHGAHLYLCGSAGGFAPSCTSAIKAAFVKHSGMSAEQAETYFFDQLVEQGRYAEDVSS
jgi:NADPH-ferrihemoprotein reductase